MGSNPTSSTETSVRVRSKNKQSAIKSEAVIVNRGQSGYEMRDLYNRKARLVYWIQRIHTDLKDHESDRKDVLKFVNHLQEKDKSILWIIRCITALLQLRREIGKPFSQVTKNDIKKLFDWIKRKEYKAVSRI